MLDTVTVACKLPNGITLHTYDEAGAKHTVTLKGNRLPIHPKTGREIRAFEVTGQEPDLGFGLTPGVRRDLWEKIEAESRDTPPFQGGMVFATGDAASTRDMATDLGEVRTGLEPIDPEKGLGKNIERMDAHEA